MLSVMPAVGRQGLSHISVATRSTVQAASRSRALHSSSPRSLPPPPAGFFARPSQANTAASTSPSAIASRLPRAAVRQQAEVAVPHTPPNVPAEQAPNYPVTWSPSQNPRDVAMRGPRFEQMTMDLQPQPLSAMEMIQREPIRLTEKRVIECDGGDGPLGHPRVFINLDKPGPKACPYCGLRYERSVQHH